MNDVNPKPPAVLPICDSHKPLYSIPMSLIGRVTITTSVGQVELYETYECVDETCRRRFDRLIGYFSVPRNRDFFPTLHCYCEENEIRFMPIVSVSTDQKTITFGCLKCGKLSDPQPWS